MERVSLEKTRRGYYYARKVFIKESQAKSLPRKENGIEAAILSDEIRSR